MNSKAINFDYKKFKKRTETLSYKFHRWFTYTRFGSWWIDFKNGVKQLIKWRKTIYKQWDYHFGDIYDLIEFKLKILADGIEKRQLVVGWEDSVRYMRICQKLCERLRDEYYGYESLDYKDSNIEFVEIDKKDEDGENMYEMKSTTTRDDLDIYFNKYSRLKEQVYNEIKNSPNFVEGAENSRSFLASMMGEKRHNKARKLLFKILEEKIELWWD
jgi:hypothetical protein